MFIDKSFIVLDILEDVTGLAVQCLAYPVEGTEADRAYLTSLDVGKVDVGYAHLLGELVQGHLPVRHHPVETQYYRHGITACGRTRPAGRPRSGL